MPAFTRGDVVKVRRAFGFGLLLYAAAGWPADTPADREMEEVRGKLADIIARDSLSNMRTLDADAFTIDSFRYRELTAQFKPTDRQHSALRIKPKAGPPFAVSVDRGPDTIGFAVENGAGEAVVQVGQRHADPGLNHLIYTVLDAQGHPKTIVHDYEIDGQADTRMHFGPSGYVEVWHLDRWYRMERKDGERFITVDGKKKLVVSRQGKLAVAD
jgi:hypothetical protein